MRGNPKDYRRDIKLPPAETTQPNASNESTHNQLHSTLTFADLSLPKTMTMPSINETTNNHFQITSSTNINMSNVSLMLIDSNQLLQQHNFQYIMHLKVH